MNKKLRIFNLDYYISVYDIEEKSTLLSFLKINNYAYRREKNVEIDKECEVLYVLAKLLSKITSINQKSGYFLGYKIGEEFDLLRFSREKVLNIELKSELPEGGISEVEDQLRRHKFILSILNKEVQSYVFISNINKIYKLYNDSFIETTIEDLSISISEDYKRNNELIDIDMNKFIISPYSDDNSFIEHRYYLSKDQKQKKDELKKSNRKRNFIKGHPGTGKSLLLFDLAREAHNEGKNVLILFCGKLSNAHDLSKKFGFSIKPIQYYKNYISEAEVIFVDETQRIWLKQFEKLLSYDDKTFYFAYDPRQILSPEEINRIDFEKLKEDKNMNKFIELKQKIRTNREMIAFVEKLCHLSVRFHDNYEYENIDIAHFTKKKEAREFVQNLSDIGYTSIELTQYRTKSTNIIKRARYFDDSHDVHNVIGREYDNVVVTLDSHFYYDVNGYLNSRYSEYYPYLEREGIYQALTRTKNNLYIVIINNPCLFESIQSILTRKFDKLIESDIE